jgi:anti-sigma regulatory factor (Ser/Thr protein kinase)
VGQTAEGVTTWTSELPRADVAPAAARVMVHEHADGMGDHAADVALLVSELVTNAVRYGDAPITVAITLDDGVLRVDVTDTGAGDRPSRKPAGTDGGFGLQLVEMLAHRWGVMAGATHVWFELDLAVPPRMPDGT